MCLWTLQSKHHYRSSASWAEYRQFTIYHYGTSFGWLSTKNQGWTCHSSSNLPVSNTHWSSCELPTGRFFCLCLFCLFSGGTLWAASAVLLAFLLGGPDLWQRLYIVLSKGPWESASLWMCLKEHIWPVMSDSVNTLGVKRKKTNTNKNTIKIYLQILHLMLLVCIQRLSLSFHHL